MTAIVHGRDAGRGAATVRKIEAAGGKARFIAADLGDADDVARLAAAAGEVDVLVNNGGFSWFGPTPELDTATFDALFASNVRSAYQLVAALAPGMATRGAAASSARTPWPATSAWPAAPPTGPPRRR
jgi:NAD(P)-dependent dehydrogenase (short-subunit alcohol dehydrogenase family)